jgi:HPt (histidine-containing phosphotransfer) domain-containing protein
MQNSVTGPTMQATPLANGRPLPPLDPETILSWRKNLPESKLREIYTAFVEQTTERVSGLRALASEDPGIFSSAVHAIAGSAGMLGAVRLEQTCRHARAQVLAGSLPAASLQTLKLEVEQAFAEVRLILEHEGLSR